MSRTFPARSNDIESMHLNFAKHINGDSSDSSSRRSSEDTTHPNSPTCVCPSDEFSHGSCECGGGQGHHMIDSEALYVDSPYAVRDPHVRECLAEGLACFILVAFGFGVNLQVSLSGEKNGSWLSITICWGIAIMLAVHCADGVSGAHLNPAVTVTKAIFKLFPWRKVPGYVAAQTIGCFMGSFIVYMLYYPRINAVDSEYTYMHHNFVTHPSDGVSNATAFYNEFLATALLMLGVMCITDKRNRPASAAATPLHLMFLIWAIGMAFGMNTGYAINPARDFGPRVFTSLAGWGFKVFTESGGYFLIPIVAPMLGAPVGALLYMGCVQNHHPRIQG